MDIYEVGGAVRDALLGVAIKDRDWVVVGGSEAAMIELGYRKVGADFPVFLHPETNEEYALARTERKSGAGYRGFVTDASSAVTLEEDLLRRDFTINAMARNEVGEVIDPYGGRRDLEQGILRHVSPAFVEDPLRVLRCARFAARFGFSVATETLTMMREIAAGTELTTLAPERVWTELQRALGEAHPQRFIEVLRECDALATLFPELDRLFGVPQPARYHPEIDTGEHLLLTLRQCAVLEADSVTRFAVMLHDLGKGTTPPGEWPSHRGHEQRGVALVDDFCARLRAPREYRELAVLVCAEHTRVHRALEMKPARIVDLLESCDAYRRPQRFEQALLACHIDATGRTGLEDDDYPQAARLRQALAATRSVNTRALVDQGLKGPEMAEAIRRERIALLTRSET